MRNWKRNAPRSTERGALVLLLLLAWLPLNADALADLHATLKRFQGSDPVRASLNYQFWRQTSEDGGPVVVQGKVDTRAEDGPQGLRLSWDRSTLQQAEAEQVASALDPANQAPTAQLMRSLTALDVGEHLNEGDSLERLLAQSTLLETRPEPWQGKPAQVLVLSLAPLLFPPSLRKAVKEIKAQARVWVAPDGTPLAYRSEVDYNGSRFMIHFQGTQKEEIHLLRTGNRLVGAWAQNEEKQTGLGQSMSTRRIYRIALN